MRVLLVVTVCTSMASFGQSPPDPTERIRQAMNASIEAQKAAVGVQHAVVNGTRRSSQPPDSFFTVPWVSPETQSPPMVTSMPQPATVTSWDPGCDPIAEPQLAALINDAAQREELKPSIVRAVIERESAARPCAVSNKGAQGLMQLMPATAAQLNVVDPFDPKQNVDAGAKLLKQLLTRYNNDLPLALGAYNAGPMRVDKVGGVPNIPETRNYVSDILSRIGSLEIQ